MTERTSNAGGVLAALGKSAAYLALFLGSQVLVTYLYLIYVLGELGMGAIDSPDFETILLERMLSASVPLTLASGLLTLAIVAIVYFAIRHMTPGEALWLRPVHGSALWSGAALAPALYVLVTLVMGLLPESLLNDYNEAASSLDEVGAAAFLCVVIVAPVVEEVVFRGLIMTRLAKAMPPWPAVLLSAAIFGACHGQFIWACYAFVLGALFGLLDMRAGSILPSILAHITFNFIGQVFTTLSHFFPEERWVLPLMAALFGFGLVMIAICRRDIAAIFRPEAPAFVGGSPAPTAPYEALAWEERFDGEETYLCRDFDSEQDPWED